MHQDCCQCSVLSMPGCRHCATTLSISAIKFWHEHGDNRITKGLCKRC